MTGHHSSDTECTRAEEALRESEHRFRTLCRYAPVGIFLADPQGDGVFVNDRICEMAGRMPEELRGKGWSRAVHPEDRERFFNEWYNAAKAGRAFAGECRFQTPEGKITWLHANAVALRNDVGEITGYLGTLTDINERKRAEEALRESKQRLQQQNRVLVDLTGAGTIGRGDLGAVLNEVTEAAAETLQVERVGVWLYNKDRSMIRCIEQYELSVRRHTKGAELAAADYPSYFQALEKNRAIDAHDAHTDPRTSEFSKNYLTPHGITSMLDAPIRVAGEMVGIVCHEHVGVSRQWILEEQSFAGSIADVAGLALETHERKQAEEALQSQTRALATQSKRLEGLIRTIAKVTETLQAEEVLHGIAEEAANLLGVEGAGFRLVEGDRLVVGGRYGPAHHIMLNPSLRLGESLSGRVVQEARPIAVPDVREDQATLPEHKAGAVAHGVVSYLGVPLRYRDAIIGVLNVYGKERRIFSEEDVSLLTAFGDQAAIGITNAHLYQEIREHAATLEARVRERERAEEALRRYQHIVSGTTDFMAFIDRDYKYQAINQSYLQAFGKKKEEIIGHTGEALFGTEVFEKVLKPYQDRCLDGQEIFYESWLDFPVWGWRFLDVHYNPFRETDGSVAGIVVSARDITERKRVEAALRESEERLKLAQSGAGIGMWDWNIQDNVATCSAEYFLLYGLPVGGHMPSYEEWLECVHPEDRERAAEDVQRAFQNIQPYDTEFRVVWPDGSVHWLASKGRVFFDGTGKAVRMTGVNIDITERKRAEEALRRVNEELERGVQERTAQLSKAIDILEEEMAVRHKAEELLRRSQEQLRALSTRLLSVQEEERSRIAREVHDELGQALTALKIDLAWVTHRLTSDQELLQKKAERMSDLLNMTVKAVRRISTDLRPRILDHLGLVATLDWQVRDFQERTGIACVFTRSSEDIVVDAPRATTLFRICQEALTNVVRHANATRVDLSLKDVGTDVVLEVRDNGRGIKRKVIADPKSLGLIGMRERVLPWRGDVLVRGVRGKGTVVTVRIPVGERGAQLPRGSS